MYLSDLGAFLYPALSWALLFVQSLGIPPEGDGRGGGAWLWFPPPLAAQAPLRWRLPILSWGRCALETLWTCEGSAVQADKAKVLDWKVKSKRGENIQRSRNGREEEDSWLGGKGSWWSGLLGTSSSCPPGPAAAAARGAAECALPWESARLTAQGIFCSSRRVTAQGCQWGAFSF